jgi:ABC-type sugar transport system ATPase subunit
MRDGRTVQEVEVSQVKEKNLVVAMVGQRRSLIERLPRKSVPKEVAFQVDSLEGREGVQVKDFTVRVGEIVGLAGLNGSGRTTFLRIIFGDLKGHCRATFFRKTVFSNELSLRNCPPDRPGPGKSENRGTPPGGKSLP